MLASDRGRAREQNCLHARVAVEDFAERGAVSGHHIQHSRRQTGFVEDLGDLESHERGFLGRLEYKGVAGCQRESDLLGRENQRKVEGSDTSDDSERAADCHGNAARRVAGDRLAHDAAAFARGGSEHADDKGHLELRLAKSRTAFVDQQIDNLVAHRLENVRGPEQDQLAFGGQGVAPDVLDGVGGVDGARHVLGSRHEDLRKRFAAGGIDHRRHFRGIYFDHLAVDVGCRHFGYLGNGLTTSCA